MSALSLATVPQDEALLRTPCEPVTEFNADLRKFANRLADAVRAHRALGLAACQAYDRRRLFAYRSGETVKVLVNPEITEREGKKTSVEGCLSLPGVRYQVWRAERVTVKGCDSKGRPVKVSATGLLACVFQHEIDHLDGRLISDHGQRVKGQ